jgi:AAA+ superfamily predicted ATPase
MATRAAADAEPGEPYGSSLDHLRDELVRIDLLVRGQVVRARQAAGDDAWRGIAITEAEVDALLARALGAPPWDAAPAAPTLGDAHALADRSAAAIERRLARSAVPPRLAQLARRFGLARFDLDVLLIALAPELDLRYERLYAYLHDDMTRKRPSVDLALHLLCRSLDDRFAARARFAAGAPLVRHDLVRLVADPAAELPLLAHALKVDDRIVDWLHGSAELEPRLARAAQRIAPAVGPMVGIDELALPPGLGAQLARLAAEAAEAHDAPGAPDAPVIYLHGPDGVGKRTTAEAFAHAAGCALLALDAAALVGASDDDAQAIVRAAEREAQLTGDILLCEHADVLLAGDQRSARRALLAALADAPGPRLLAGATPWEPSDALRGRPFVRVELAAPDVDARTRLWVAALAETALGDDVDLAARAAQLALTGGQIHDAAATARGLARLRGGAGAPVTAADLGEACRRHSGRRFGGLARKVTARPAWDDLVLTADRVQRLRELCDHARHRATVFDRWGFDRKLPNGKGLGLLFTGAPGTGKTLAASVIATELGLDLYQIDLASVVSKWIGETEKQLGRIFDEAERGHAVLLFDEADALFGKRSEVQDAHDRYANLETSYLLQRLEAYEGIVILASNFRRNMDEAFMRRLRFIVEFPLPDERDRLRIWERLWPAEMPRAPDLDLGVLARRFELAGAYLRNIALAAAFLAAAEGQPVGQRHALHAARREYQKLGKMIDEAAFGIRP